MELDRLLYQLMVRAIKLPGIRQVATSLYRSHCRMEPLVMDETTKARLVSTLPPRPTGHSYWSKDQRPCWSDAVYDLSIIIPFYNTEEYAQLCIQSVLDQKTTYSVQLILVDDGSPDHCGEILEQYRRDPDIIVLHQENAGLSAARNSGIRASQGAYLMFVDSDDSLCPGAIQALMSAAKEDSADIVDGSFQTTTKRGVPKRIYSHPSQLGTHGEGAFGYAWGKVFRRELFQDICFPEGYWSEDTIISTLIFQRAARTRTIENLCLYYRTNPHGISLSCFRDPKCIDKFYIIQDIVATFVHLGMDLSLIDRRLLWELGPSVYGRIQALTEQQKQAIFCMICELVQKYHLVPDTPPGSFFESELWESYANRQYYRWKWSSILM